MRQDTNQASHSTNSLIKYAEKMRACHIADVLLNSLNPEYLHWKLWPDMSRILLRVQKSGATQSRTVHALATYGSEYQQFSYNMGWLVSDKLCCVVVTYIHVYVYKYKEDYV